MSRRRPSYTPSPTVPPEVLPRLAAIVEVLSGLKTVSEAARSLGLSRNHFQTILHRAVLSLAESIAPKRSGRPSKPTEVATLRGELQQLQRENRWLQAQVGSTQRLLEVAGGLLHGRIRPTSRQPRTRKTTGAASREDSDPDIRCQRVLEGVAEMRRLGLTARLAATIAGLDVSTLRRWRARARDHTALVRRPSIGTGVSPTGEASAAALVRRLHGLIGTEALRHSVAGLSRRAAARIKAKTLTAMERERKASLLRLTITQPGIMRGIDAMHFATDEDAFYALIAADGAIPYRTGLTTTARYDAESVARALSTDLERNGAPLVLRLDRAKAHGAPAVRAILEAHGMLVLHGPPRYPRFYGQLERQNREHRQWIAQLPQQSRALLEPSLNEMLHTVNTLWRRRTLGWKTATEVWTARPRLTVDRTAFREEVHDRARSIAHRLKRRRQPADLAERLAIEQTLERMGYLRQEIGGWC